MVTGEAMLEELIQLEPSRLNENTQKLFYTIMKVIDERDELEQKNTELRIQVSSRETVVDELQQENQQLKEDYNKVVHEATEFESKVYELEKEIELYHVLMKQDKEKINYWVDEAWLSKHKINKALDKLYCWGEALDKDFQQEMIETLKDGDKK